MGNWLLLLGLLGACVSDRDDGHDMLPKRGDTATDPTIVAATAECKAANDPTLGTGLRIEASDPKGVANLATCTTTIVGESVEAELDDGVCYTYSPRSCTPGETLVVDVLVTNTTGGFTKASVTLSAH